MKLKEKGNIWLTMWRYLHGNYGKKPNGLCSLFWGGLLGSVLLLLTLFPYGVFKLIYNKIKGKGFKIIERNDLAVIDFSVNFIILMCWAVGFFMLQDVTDLSLWQCILVGIFVIPVFSSIIIGIVFLILSVGEIKQNQNIKILTEGVSSFWNKMCPRINWK